MEENQPRHRRSRRKRANLSLASLLALGLTAWLSYQTPPAKAPSPVSTSQPNAKTLGDSTTQGAANTVLEHQPGLWHVTHDVDGDTINVAMGNQKETVRFIGIDTPETHDPRKPVQCFGEAAAAHTKALLEGKDVRLAADPQDSDRDKYHRLLRYVYLPDGTLINARLIQDGYAFAYVVFPFSKLGDFRALEAEARDNNRGLWAGCNVDASSEIKQTTSNK